MNEMNLIVTWLSNLDRFYFVTFNRVARSALVRCGPSWWSVVVFRVPDHPSSKYEFTLRTYVYWTSVWSRIYFLTKFSIFVLRACSHFEILSEKNKWLSHHWYKNSKFRKYLKMTTSPFIQKLKILQKDRKDFSILKLHFLWSMQHAS